MHRLNEKIPARIVNCIEQNAKALGITMPTETAVFLSICDLLFQSGRSSVLTELLEIAKSDSEKRETIHTEEVLTARARDKHTPRGRWDL
jgi:hypothetical protein